MCVCAWSCLWCRASEGAPAVVSFWHYTKNNIIDEGGGGGGVGWGGIIASFAVRSHALAHIRHASLLYVLMHLHTYVMLRCCTSHALAHIRHATLLYVLMHLHTYVMLRCCTFSCTCTHTSCYAAVRSHALAHIRHATLLYVLMHLHTYVMLRCCTFSCTCTHTSCYAAVRSHAPVVRHGCRQRSPKLCISLDVSLPPLEKWACQSAISRMINMQMMMMMMMTMMMMKMKLLLMLKFCFSAFCGPPCKMFGKWQQREPPQMPGNLFMYTCYTVIDKELHPSLSNIL